MGDDICPPYHSSLIWWLIHHPHNPVTTPERERDFNEVDRYFAAIGVVGLAARTGDRVLVEQAGQAMERLKSNPMPALMRLAGMR